MYRLIFAWAVCFGLTACGGSGAVRNGAARAELTALSVDKDRVEVLYFHGRQRCATCLAIEKHAREAVETRFADALKSGALIYRTIDISKPENEPIADKYEVTWSSLFVCKWKDGRESAENLTGFAFAHARTAPETFRNGVIEKVESLLK